MVEAIIGPKLLDCGNKGAEIATADAIKGGKVIALYFSAHWCGPCNPFFAVAAIFSFFKIDRLA